VIGSERRDIDLPRLKELYSGQRSRAGNSLVTFAYEGRGFFDEQRAFLKTLVIASMTGLNPPNALIGGPQQLGSASQDGQVVNHNRIDAAMG
jgi:hypothetical protein